MVEFIKVYVWFLGMLIALVNAIIFYRLSKLREWRIRPFHAAVIALNATLTLCAVLVLVLDRMGLYPN